MSEQWSSSSKYTVYRCLRSTTEFGIVRSFSIWRVQHERFCDISQSNEQPVSDRKTQFIGFAAGGRRLFCVCHRSSTTRSRGALGAGNERPFSARPAWPVCAGFSNGSRGSVTRRRVGGRVRDRGKTRTSGARRLLPTGTFRRRNNNSTGAG